MNPVLKAYGRDVDRYISDHGLTQRTFGDGLGNVSQSVISRIVKGFGASPDIYTRIFEEYGIAQPNLEATSTTARRRGARRAKTQRSNVTARTAQRAANVSPTAVTRSGGQRLVIDPVKGPVFFERLMSMRSAGNWDQWRTLIDSAFAAGIDMQQLRSLTNVRTQTAANETRGRGQQRHAAGNQTRNSQGAHAHVN